MRNKAKYIIAALLAVCLIAVGQETKFRPESLGFNLQYENGLILGYKIDNNPSLYIYGGNGSGVYKYFRMYVDTSGNTVMAPEGNLTTNAAINFASLVPAGTAGSFITTGTTWVPFPTAGAAGIKLLLSNTSATGNFASIRIRARSDKATPTWNQNTLAGDFSASAGINDYGELIGLSAYAQVPAAYTQSRATHWITAIKGALTDYAGATSSGSRYVLVLDDACANKAATAHYAMYVNNSGVEKNGIMQVTGSWQYGLNLNTGVFSVADIQLGKGAKIFNSASGTVAISDQWVDTLTATSATPGTVRAITGAMTTFTSMTSGNLVGVRGSITQGGNIAGGYLYGAQGKAITGAYTFSGTALAGLYGQIDVTGGTISAGHVAAVQANVYGANSGSIPMTIIYAEHAGGGVIDSLIEVFGKSDYVFRISSNTHTNVSTTGTAGSTTSKGWIKVIVDGAVRYIPLTDSVS